MGIRERIEDAERQLSIVGAPLTMDDCCRWWAMFIVSRSGGGPDHCSEDNPWNMGYTPEQWAWWTANEKNYEISTAIYSKARNKHRT